MRYDWSPDSSLAGALRFLSQADILTDNCDGEVVDPAVRASVLMILILLHSLLFVMRTAVCGGLSGAPLGDS